MLILGSHLTMDNDDEKETLTLSVFLIWIAAKSNKFVADCTMSGYWNTSGRR